jgi:hypothetical protein
MSRRNFRFVVHLMLTCWAVDSTGLIYSWSPARLYGFGGPNLNGTLAFLNVPLPANVNPAAVQIAVGSGAGIWVLDASDEVFTFVRP